MSTCCAFCQEEFEVDERVILVREARFGFGKRTGIVTYNVDGQEEEAVHPMCLGPYVTPEVETEMRQILKTEAETDVGAAFMAASEAMNEYYGEDNPVPQEGYREPRRRRRRGRR